MIKLPSTVASFAAKQRAKADKVRAQHGIEAQPWYRITNAADPDEAELLLYDEIGGWWGANAEDFIAELAQVTAPNLRVRINSPGGSVFEGIAIANALRSFAGTVTCQVDGIAASIASVIAMAADRVEMAPQTMLMIHDASGLCYGTAAEMEEMGELLDLLSDNIADAYAARAGGTREQWRDLMRAESWYLPDDAVEAGLADEAILTPKSGEPVPEPVEPNDDEAEPEMRREFDFAAYGYKGPRREDPTAEAGLTEDIRGLIGEEVATQLAAVVAPPASEPAAEPEPVEPEPVAEPGQANTPWGAAIARLAQPQDPWAASVAHLSTPKASSSAATEAA
ncbi:head maturation protease, ClpP-related [Streptomyces sp. NPDC048504]|uniref:head maturation protease, ClpP-related n=1 Tax=Streptomyces sp. NPDC048504 TaxID=3365559 RepID=UPI0037237542